MFALLKASLPGSVVFLLVGIICTLFHTLLGKKHRLSIVGLVVLIALYTAFSIPLAAKVIGQPLVWGLETIEKCEKLERIKALVVLDAATKRVQSKDDLFEFPVEYSALRALEACRVYRLMEEPLVIVSAGNKESEIEWAPEGTTLYNLLLKCGIPKRKIILDSEATNTRSHALNVKPLLNDYGIKKIVLVTSPSHIRRSVWSFRAQDIIPVPSPSKSSIENLKGWRAVWPSTKALEYTQEVFHEYLGLAYYYFKGYI